jgi:hypothetical protein
VIAPALPERGIFHPPSLLLSLLSLLRRLPPAHLQTAFSLLPASSSLHAYLLALSIEDLAGVRIARVAERKASAKALERDFDLGWMEPTRHWDTVSAESTARAVPAAGAGKAGGPASPGRLEGVKIKKAMSHFPPPRIGYIRKVVVLPVQGKPGPGSEEKMKWMKVRLILWAAANLDLAKGEWAFVNDDQKWVDEFSTIIGDPDADGLLAVIRSLLGADA